jgi:hypothetical protein
VGRFHATEHACATSGVLVFALRGEMIQAVHVMADPAKLGFLGFQLASAG